MRISTTTLESFRLWRDQDWMSESDLIATILGQFTPNRKVQIGLAFGRILEDPDRYFVPGGFEAEGVGFDRDVIQPCLDLIDRRGTFEVKAVRVYEDCDVVCKADHMLGSHLSEFKTTLSSFDAEKYLDSYQWRFMADVLKPTKITYRVFCLSECEANGVIALKDIHNFNLYPYPALHDDCCALVRDFKAYVEARDLVEPLRRRQREAA